MHRLLVPTELLEADSPLLPQAALKHLRVVRPEEGEQIELFDGRGKWRIYSYTNRVLRAHSHLFVAPSPSLNLTLFACVTKGSRWDWTIEKATELGVARIVPVMSARTIVRIPASERAAKRGRWQRIVEDAARQSDAKWVPEVCAPIDFAAALSLVRETICFIGALTNPPSPSLVQAVRSFDLSAQRALSTFIGPEGDFTPSELAALTEVAVPTSFGPTILRAETAAIYALSVITALSAAKEVCDAKSDKGNCCTND